MKKLLLFVVALATVSALTTSSVTAAKPADKGFNEFGYNYTARNFVGTGASWCADYGVFDEATCNEWLMGPFYNDKLVMKWNEAWDACNDNGYDDPAYCAGAWTDNEWNGMNGGSGAVWHYKIIWVGSEGESSPYWREGGYLVWGNYEVVMDQGTDKTGTAYPPCSGEPNNGGHTMCALAIPSGYGHK